MKTFKIIAFILVFVAIMCVSYSFNNVTDKTEDKTELINKKVTLYYIENNRLKDTLIQYDPKNIIYYKKKLKYKYNELTLVNPKTKQVKDLKIVKNDMNDEFFNIINNDSVDSDILKILIKIILTIVALPAVFMLLYILMSCFLEEF